MRCDPWPLKRTALSDLRPTPLLAAQTWCLGTRHKHLQTLTDSWTTCAKAGLTEQQAMQLKLALYDRHFLGLAVLQKISFLIPCISSPWSNRLYRVLEHVHSVLTLVPSYLVCWRCIESCEEPCQLQSPSHTQCVATSEAIARHEGGVFWRT